MAQPTVCAHCGFRNSSISNRCARCEQPLRDLGAPPTPSSPYAQEARRPPAEQAEQAAARQPAAARPRPQPQARVPLSAAPTAPLPEPVRPQPSEAEAGGARTVVTAPFAADLPPATRGAPARPPATPQPATEVLEEAPKPAAPAPRRPAPQPQRLSDGVAAPPAMHARQNAGDVWGTAPERTQAFVPAPRDASPPASRPARAARPAATPPVAPPAPAAVAAPQPAAPADADGPAPAAAPLLTRLTLALAIDGAVVLICMFAHTALEVGIGHADWPSEGATGLEAVAWWIYVHHRSARRIALAGLFVAALQTALGVRFGHTLGRLLCGLTLVERAASVAPRPQLSWSVVAWHLLGGTLCLCSLGAGFYWMVVDSHGRTWANCLSRTLVLRRAPSQ